MQKVSKRTHDFETDSSAIPGPPPPPPPLPPQLKLTSPDSPSIIA